MRKLSTIAAARAVLALAAISAASTGAMGQAAPTSDQRNPAELEESWARKVLAEPGGRAKTLGEALAIVRSWSPNVRASIGLPPTPVAETATAAGSGGLATAPATPPPGAPGAAVLRAPGVGRLPANETELVREGGLWVERPIHHAAPARPVARPLMVGVASVADAGGSNSRPPQVRGMTATYEVGLGGLLIAAGGVLVIATIRRPKRDQTAGKS